MMKRIFLCLAILLVAKTAYGQSNFKAQILNEESKLPVVGAIVSIKDTDIAGTTDSSGRVELTNIPRGEQTVVVSSPDHEAKEVKYTFPLVDQSEQMILLEIKTVGEVTITSTSRISREIDDVPTRIEAISEEEVDEKTVMRPANVSMVLNESTGIKVQQTSATSNTQSVRIQGLDGRYTQILKDGFPAFGGFSGSLSLLDIPPLDLRQVEIVKGPSATFYGGGAIAGVVNFISKEPEKERATSLIINQTSALGTDFSLYDSQEFNRFGYAVLGSLNFQKEYDVDDNDFSELPRTFSFGVSPRLFFDVNDRTRLVIGNSTSYQKRKGGDVFVIRDQADNFHQYFETNTSVRNITTIQFERELDGGRKLIAKQSIAVFSRKIEIPDYSFKGRQLNAYTDVSYFLPAHNHAFVFGASAAYDQFREDQTSSSLIRRNETRTAMGGFAQDNVTFNDKFSLEAGLRLDYLRHYGLFPLPRVSMLYRFDDHLSSRFSVGLGYKAPTIFTEDAEEVLFQNVLPIGNTLKAERSRGGTFDVNYKNTIGEKISYSINHMFFYTRIVDPLILTTTNNGLLRFMNATAPVTSAGFETNVRLVYDIVKLFAGYTFTDAKAGYLTGNQTLPLVPKSRLNSALLFEKESNFKAGLEAYYTSSQILSNGSRTRHFWVLGIFGEKTYGKISLFFNAENITDTRQSRFGPVVFPPHQNPTFAEIYTHTEGRVFNGGVKLRF
ncbi:MAG TPA: TonB-dependent receptor [Pyrinomonadaceae bacterium]|nr:TonB-dependent receptor [Pyrinomonadaceae bacterium]